MDKALSNVLFQQHFDYDTVIFFGQQTVEEGKNRIFKNQFDWSKDFKNDVKTYSKMEGKKTIVVLTTPGATLTDFTKDADAVLVNFYAGEKYPEAIGNILTGLVNPSGKLPVSFPNFENDIYMSSQQWPGVDLKAEYSEKLRVGYRWYDYYEIDPAYSFGHGLSYTTFNYKRMQIDDRNVTVLV